MNREKQHRYVSLCGPVLPFASDPALAQAIAIAENEGWPVRRLVPVPAPLPYERRRARFVSPVERVTRSVDAPDMFIGR